ncbi:Glycosyltransferase involved in cell wall bisynthesis [Salegentibacter holothuriorum]|uniref:Glycosyltransferase involved in cell wall bisynthesis n=2 Tax=Salegentibacter holothuriorum TaxID=241145 RepID=A0A1T5CMA2_9FLAO|nr:Glycosyltransferase involved in cell wall bisynthesis [Salegentibacter holothuriorum]
MLSIFAPHFFNWTEQLRDSGHEVYWLDIYDSNTKVKQIDFVEQITGWRYKWDYPGRYFLKSKAPGITRLINIFNERNFQKQLEKEIRRIEPDVVHSFVMYLGGVPALPVMKKFPDLKWAFTAWGSDMYYYQQQTEYLAGMKKALAHIDYMFADCQRDYNIAREHGFEGRFLGVFPGGGGFNFGSLDPFIRDKKNRNIILIKGYQGLHGKCIDVLVALQKLEMQLKDYRIIVFGAAIEVFKFVETSSLKEFGNLEIYGKLNYQDLMKLMGRTLIYIGNSSSDGMPNTLLEAIIMEAFPIQSNPGGATAEIIQHKENGLLIEEPEDSQEISSLLLEALNNYELRKKAVCWNSENIKPELVREKIKARVLKAYDSIEKDL